MQNEMERSQNISQENSKYPSRRRGTAKTVSYIFEVFKTLYGAVWTKQAYCDSENHSVLSGAWLNSVSQMTETEIREAICYLKSKANDRYTTYPPNPIQFMRIAIDVKLAEIPSMLDCYNAAIEGNWDLHAIVKPIALECDIYWLRHQASGYDARKRFSGAYAKHKEKFINDGPVSSSEGCCKKYAKSYLDKDHPRMSVESRVKWFEGQDCYKSFCQEKDISKKRKIWKDSMELYNKKN